MPGRLPPPRGASPRDRTDRDALRGRLQRALPRRLRRRARLRVPRLEHPLCGRRPPLHPGARARGHRSGRPLATRNRRRRERRAARELRRCVAHGRLPVASGGAEPASHSVGRAPRRRPRPPAGRRARGAVRAPGPTRRPHRLARPHRSPTRPIRSRATRRSTCSIPRTDLPTRPEFVERYRAAQRGAQRADHQLGLRGTRTAGGERWIGARVPRVPYVGRSPLSRPQPRPITPATRLLRRRHAHRELHGSGSCRRVHAAVVALDVESRPCRSAGRGLTSGAFATRPS